MRDRLNLESANAMQAAFRISPELADEHAAAMPLGIYRWRTPPMESFSLPETGDLIVALHLGGSRDVRAMTESGLSRAVSMPGLMTVLPPGRTAAFRTAGSISLVTLHIPAGAAQQYCDHASMNRLTRSTSPYFAFRDAYASASMQALLQVARRGNAPVPDYVGKLTDALLCHLGGHDSQAGDDAPMDCAAGMLGDKSLEFLLAYIDARIGSRLSVDMLAKQTGLSRAAFNRTFRLLTGLPFHQFLMRRRILRARQWLRQSESSLACISQELGFSNQSHFTAAFKALQNCTPRQYRNERDR